MNTTKRWLFYIPVVFGAILLVFMVKNKQEPNRPPTEESRRAVHVVTVQPMTVIPRVTGYGYVEATETWEAITEVSGKVVAMHPELKKGAFLAKDTLLLRIDPQSYGLAKTKGQASVMSIEAQLTELDQQRKNTEKLLSIEKEALALTHKEIERKRQLQRKGYLSQSELDNEEKNLLARDAAVKNHLNTLALIPSQEQALLAQKKSNVSSLGEMQLDLERTEIRAPFDCRIAEVNVEVNEYAKQGTVLLKAINIASVEIPVKLAPGEFVNLLPAEFSVTDVFAGNITMEKIREQFGVKAEVRLPMFNREATWEGTFRRTSASVDLQTGALTIFIAVSSPYEKMEQGVRPPLMPNLYCEVELQGRSRADRYLVPINAVHDGRVYLLNKESRLSSQPVTVEMVMDDYAVIHEGLQPGEMVVLTDLVPAIEGMLLTPIADSQAADRIQAFGSSL